MVSATSCGVWMTFGRDVDAQSFVDRIADISKTLSVTEGATKTLLKIVGEDPNVPDDKLPEALSKVAGDYKRLQAQAAALDPENPTARQLVDAAKPEIDAGHFQHALELLGQATRAIGSIALSFAGYGKAWRRGAYKALRASSAPAASTASLA
jgi:hypothetical protein